MKRLEIVAKHAYAVAEVRVRLQALLRRAVSEYGLEVDWMSEREVTLRRGRFLEGAATIDVRAIRVTLELSWGLQFSADRIETEIKRELVELCAASSRVGLQARNERGHR